MRTMGLKVLLMAALSCCMVLGASSCLSEIIPWPASVQAAMAYSTTTEESGHRF